MKVYISKIQGTLWSGEAEALIVPAKEGQCTILHGHIPFVTALTEGEIVVRKGKEVLFSHFCTQGILEVRGEEVIVLL
jgi:F0F1-type ATP synthase epsilon subunit